MVLPVGEHRHEQVGAAQQRAVGRRRAPEGQVVAATRAAVRAVDREVSVASRASRASSCKVARTWTSSGQEPVGWTLTSMTPGSGVTDSVAMRGSPGSGLALDDHRQPGRPRPPGRRARRARPLLERRQRGQEDEDVPVASSTARAVVGAFSPVDHTADGPAPRRVGQRWQADMAARSGTSGGSHAIEPVATGNRSGELAGQQDQPAAPEAPPRVAQRSPPELRCSGSTQPATAPASGPAWPRGRVALSPILSAASEGRWGRRHLFGQPWPGVLVAGWQLLGRRPKANDDAADARAAPRPRPVARRSPTGRRAARGPATAARRPCAR